MDSNTLSSIHGLSVMLFLLTYVIKTILLFTNKSMLEKYTKATRIPEIIISVAFLISGIWLYTILGGIKKYHIIKLIFVVVSIPLAVIGFKKHKKGLVLFSLLLIVLAYGLAEMSKNKVFLPKNAGEISTINSPFADGALVYQQNCSFCHGEDGKKKYRDATDLSLSVSGEDAIVQMVREGSKGKMPSYNIILSDENIKAVAGFVKSFQSNTVIE